MLCEKVLAKPRSFDTERVGFEPTVPEGTPVFETGPFGHSGTSPAAGSRDGPRDRGMIVFSEDPDCKGPKAETAESRRKVGGKSPFTAHYHRTGVRVFFLAAWKLLLEVVLVP